MSQDQDPEDLNKSRPADFDRSRRDFLRKLGIAMGGVAVGGGGAVGTAFGQSGIPNDYKFYRVLTIDPMVQNLYVGGLIPGVMMGNYSSSGDDPQRDVIYFHGKTLVS